MFMCLLLHLMYRFEEIRDKLCEVIRVLFCLNYFKNNTYQEISGIVNIYYFSLPKVLKLQGKMKNLLNL